MHLYLLIEAVEKKSGGVGEVRFDGFGGRDGSVESSVRGRGVESLWILQTRAYSRHRNHYSSLFNPYSIDLIFNLTLI